MENEIMENEKVCLNCGGVGYHTCATCNGTGITNRLHVPEYGKATMQASKCPWCEGTGKKKCGCCYGTGIITDLTRKKKEMFLKKLKKYLTGKVSNF